MSCFGLCGKEQKPKYDEFRVVYNKAAETVVIETQTSDHEVPQQQQQPHNTVALIDCGSSVIRAGFAGDESPLITIPTVVGKSTVDDVTKKVFGATALTSSNSYKLSYPVERGFIKDWHDAEELLEHVIEKDLHIQPKMQQLMLTEAPNNPPANQEKTAEMMFEKFQFSSFLLVPSTPMGMYGYGSTTGVIVESGAGQTHIVAVKDGDYIKDSYRHIPVGGNDLTKYMGQLLTQSGNARYFHGKRNEHEILNEIKRIGCHIVLNYDEEVKNSQMNPDFITDHAILRDGTMIAMKTESYQVPELLFKPELIGIHTGGIPQNIYDCIESCEPALRAQLYGNICLCGGNTMFPGIRDRLLWEVRTFAGHNVNVKINALPQRENLVFLGASLLGVCPKLRDNLISYQEYREVGSQIVHWKFF
ncbi:actin-like [Lucilia sericata]|uniref:actin-like n=1 Tax=Lucilia sericata TaxID=13632 RepID=UPI0018A85C6C|nr:actin-like [Lucilia sericata]